MNYGRKIGIKADAWDEVEKETANKVFLPTFTVFSARSLTILDHFEPTHEIVVLIAMADPEGVRLNPTTRPRF